VLGNVRYEVTEKEKVSRVFRRSLFVAKDIIKGEQFTEENVRAIRPEHGLSPKCLKDILGKKANQNIGKGASLRFNLIVSQEDSVVS